MKKWNRLFYIGISLCLVSLLLCLFLTKSSLEKKYNNTYLANMNEVVYIIKDDEYKGEKLKENEIGNLESDKFINISYYLGEDKIIKEDLINGKYRKTNNPYVSYCKGDLVLVFEYEYSSNVKGVLIYETLGFSLVLIIFLVSMLLIKKKILNPFKKINEYPMELAKGNLDAKLLQNNDNTFNEFIWGMDNLKESLEEHKQNEMKLEREKKLILLSVSHDIKTPLSAISLYASALEKDALSKEECAENIKLNTKKITRYIDGLIDSMNVSKVDTNIKDENIKDVVLKIKETYKPRLELLNISFEVDKVDDMLIRTDMFKLLEVVGNLIDNAIKYGDGNYIKIHFTLEDENLLIHVLNSGNTLKDDEYDNIFNEFYRSTNTKNKQGSGLGLYICKKIMRELNGEIYAKRNNEDMEIILVSPLSK